MSDQAILIVDDETLTREMLRSYFEQEGFRADAAEDGEKMLGMMERGAYDVVLLDILMPGVDGLSLAPRVRERYPSTGIILITNKRADIDRILGLEVGADDYVTKPFNLRELLARVHALLRRLAPTEGKASADSDGVGFRVGDWYFDPRKHGLRGPAGENVLLPKGEFVILGALARRAGLVCSRDHLLGVLERELGQASPRSLDVQISRLRQRLGDAKREIIVTVHGFGYLLRLPSP